MPFSFPAASLIALLAAGALLSGCVATNDNAASEPAPDYDLIMGEIALLRDMPHTAVEQYLHAAMRLDDPGVARRGLLIAIHAGDMSAARQLAERWEALAPDDVELAQYQAILTFRAGDLERAFGYLLRVADGETGDAIGANLQMITSLLAGESNVWRAADLMARLAEARPDYPEGWYGAALLALEADRPRNAERFASRALEQQPGLRDAMFLRARAALADPGAGPEADAERILAPLRPYRNDADPGLRYRYAGLLVLAGRNREADALFQDILVNHPDQHDARIARALLALDEGRDDVAAAELQALLERQGRVADAMYFLGMLAERRGNPENAAAWYGRVAPDAADSGRWLEAQAAFARLLLQGSGIAAALQYFDELRAQWPEQAFELVLREADLLTAAGHSAAALERLDTFSADPYAKADQEIAWRTGVAAANAGMTARAERIFREMLARDPGNPLLLNALAWLLLEQTERREEAAALLERALAAAPANAAILDSAGWLRFLEGKPVEARRLLEASWRRQPSALAGLHLLDVLQTLGDDAAHAAFERELRETFPQLPAVNERNE